MRRVLAGIALAALLAGCASSSSGSSDTAVVTAPPVTTSVVATTVVPTTPPADTATTATTGAAPPATTAAPVDTTPATTIPPLTAGSVTLAPFATYAEPIAMAVRSSEPGVFYLAERSGIVLRVDPATDTAGTTVLDIHRNTTEDAERGLLGLAFGPDGSHLYVSYTDRNGNTEVDEYGVAADTTIDTESRRTVFQQKQPYANHNGGNIAFGPDGYLYLGLGDGGAADDPQRRGQNLTTVLGKLLRIDPSTPSGDLGYTIPADNPFVGTAGARGEIWSAGLRNPWRFSFDGQTGDLWIGDVGQDKWEEVDVAPAADGGGRGANFGWSAWEGTHRFNTDQADTGQQAPLLDYPHGTEGCSVSGGYVYRGTSIPALVGTYVFGDYCSGKVWAVQTAADGSATRLELGNVPNLVSFGQDDQGELYALSLSGPVVRLSPA